MFCKFTISRSAFKKSVYLCVVLILLYCLYYFFLKINNISFTDGLLVLLSIIILSNAFYSICGNGIRTDNLFYISFYLAVLLNQFDISAYQVSKDWELLYYLTGGPLVFGGMLYLAEKKLTIVNDDNDSNIKVNAKYCLFGLYFLLKMYMISKTGIRILSTNLNPEEEYLYIIPGLSGLVLIMYYIILMQSIKEKGKKKLLIISLLILFEGVFSGHRGEIMRILLFVVLDYAIREGKRIVNKKNVKRIAMIMLSIICMFGIMGEYRQSVIYQAANATQAFSMPLKIQSRIDNSVICWFYAYTGFNIEVLNRTIKIMDECSYKMESIMLPITRVMSGTVAVEAYYQSMAFGDYGGINAATFLKPYIIDMGYFYFIELLFAGMIYYRLVRYAKRNSYSSYIFILMLISLVIFGDYMFSVDRFYALISNIIFERIFLIRNNCVLNNHRV